MICCCFPTKNENFQGWTWYNMMIYHFVPGVKENPSRRKQTSSNQNFTSSFHNWKSCGCEQSSLDSRSGCDQRAESFSTWIFLRHNWSWHLNKLQDISDGCWLVPYLYWMCVFLFKAKHRALGVSTLLNRRTAAWTISNIRWSCHFST